MNHGEFVHIPSSSTENLPHYSKAKQAHARRCRLIFSQTSLFDTCDKQTAEKEAQRCCFPCPAFSSLLRLLLVLPFPPLLSFLLSSFFLPLLSLLWFIFLSFVLLQFNAIKPMNAWIPICTVSRVFPCIYFPSLHLWASSDMFRLVFENPTAHNDPAFWWGMGPVWLQSEYAESNVMRMGKTQFRTIAVFHTCTHRHSFHAFWQFFFGRFILWGETNGI